MIDLAEWFSDLYVLHVEPQSSFSIHVSTCNNTSSLDNNALIWHHRVWHVSYSIHKSIFIQFHFISFKKIRPCNTCHFSKLINLPYHVSNTLSFKFFDLVHDDIWGPYSTPSIDGHKYFLTLVDDYSSFTWMSLIKMKSKIRKHLSTFISFSETQFSMSLKCLRSDNGPRFSMYGLFNSKGILYQRSFVEYLQQNGLI